MNSLEWALFSVVLFLLTTSAVYVLARVVFHAWFRAKQDHDASSSRREIPNGEA